MLSTDIWHITDDFGVQHCTQDLEEGINLHALEERDTVARSFCSSRYHSCWQLNWVSYKVDLRTEDMLS